VISSVFCWFVFRCIHFHVGPCCYPRNYRLPVHLITCM